MNLTCVIFMTRVWLTFKEMLKDWGIFGIVVGAVGWLVHQAGYNEKIAMVVTALLLWVFKVESRMKDLEVSVFRKRKK